MKRNWQRVAICAAIALGSMIVTLLLAAVPFFQLLNLKAQDAHFVLRGAVPTQNIVIIGVDEKTLNTFPELESFWHPYYADAIRGAADGGAKVFVLDHFFEVPVEKYQSGLDSMLAGAFAEASPKMPVITAFIASKADQKDAAFAVPLNMMSSTFGTVAYANLTVDRDDFVRRQELIEAPAQGVATADLKRSMALRAAERFLGKDVEFRNGKLYLGDREIPTGNDRDMIINYAGPAGTVPRVSLVDFIRAVRSGNQSQLAQWVKGKIVLLGPDERENDAHDTPFFTAFGLTDRWRTPGVEIHANTLRTLLTGDFLKPVPAWARILSLAIAAGATVAVVTSFAGAQMGILCIVVLGLALLATHILFIAGWLLSSTELMLVFVWALVGGVIYRFATAEKKSSFFKSAVALFVGKQVALSLDQNEKIGLTGKRQMVTIMFSDIRGFTAFCESKDPAEVVDLLNAYMATMCSIIVRHGGQVNKFIGDGILAVFSDEDDGARPGDHARRAVACAMEMVVAPGEFKTGTGLHSGEVVIGNVGSSDKMEFTVLGDTVNLASRLESLNKEHKTKLLLSEATFEIIGGAIDTLYLGTVSVRGKSVPMKLYTAASLVSDVASDDAPSRETPATVAGRVS
ncbi:MAG: adenylate/guanylate cyclase domain-containing protein [Bryobacteraceae bacterium]|jgi:adenylate cyclase